MRGLSGVALTAALALAAFGGSSLPAGAQAPAVTAFEGARVIVGDGRASIENGTLLVEGTKITQAGPAVDVRVPEGAARVNLTGKTVMPMLIDTHTHLSQTRDGLTRDLKRRAYYGVSAAMSMGTSDTDVDLQMRGETAPGMARLFTAWRGITRPEPGRTTAPFWINSEQEGRKAVQELAARKVDIVKVWIDDRDGKYAKLTPALYGAVIDEAHKNGMRVTAHIFTLEDAKGVLRAGIDYFAHSVRDKDIDDEFLNMMKARPNMIVDPNLPDRGVKVDRSWLRESVTAEEFQKIQAESKDDPKAQQFFGIQSRNLARLNAAGIRIALGTDGSIPWEAHEEMADMVASGMTPAQVLVAATRNSAALVGLKDVGTVEKGKSADFLVLDANPLDDITNTRRINTVYLRGTAVDRATSRARWTGKALL
jgi:imidazolonepropionase-like amidohydrolase